MTVLLAAGGTGGHVFPALAVGEELRRRDVGIVWVGRPDGLECRVATEHGFEFQPMAAGGFFGKNLRAKVGGLWLLGKGFFRSLRLLRRVAPDAMVATGGFATAAVLAAAVFTGLPFFLLEQNCVPGRVTGLFARWARETYLGFPTAKPFAWPHSVTGNPLRREVAADRRSDDGRTVLVLGGSLGAQALNLAAIDVASALTNLHFIILTGRRDYDFVRSRLRSRNCELVEFTARPEELYRRATVAVSRAGGVVLSELVAFGIPAILVPFPLATDRHQDANARYLASVGAASVLDQHRLSGLTSLVRELMGDGPRRTQMAAAARAAAMPDAAGTISEKVIETRS
jgi:UDP-N-acetylglucosamine--N-acetylmuramyl-(pentapeptide) pyrophosphoryl-undecaprenol N-acetylglucosamine transferase